MTKLKLEKLINKQKGYITTQDAKKAGIHREYLTMLIEEEKLIRTLSGVYQSPDVFEDMLYALQKKKKRMIYSHETALYLHGYSDRDLNIYSVTFPTGYNTTQVAQANLKKYTIKTSLFDLGKSTIMSPYGNEIVVYDKERTICDIVRSRNRIEKQIFIDGMKKYARDSKKDLNKLSFYAKQMGIDNVLRKYIEILL